MQTPVQTPQKLHKTRSLSDSAPQLSPSPKFREPARTSKDDHTVVSSPHTPRRPEFLSKGLHLKMPEFKEAGMSTPIHLAQRVPLSPQLDAHNTYASPATLLPRRSRGAEFSRACTNLHHSTLADQPSPDSSPTITQKGLTIPSKKSRANSMIMDSPNLNYPAWGMSNGERTAPSSSLGSISMIDADSSSSSDDPDAMEPDDNEDPMLMTPQATKINPFSAATPGNNPTPWTNIFSPGAAPTFMSIQRRRLGKGRSRKSSSSASGHSSLASPVPGSPPNGKSEGYFAREAVMRQTGSRRESLSLFTNDLHISSGNDSGDEAVMIPQTPGVVRRPVTRRGNLLPKSRQFGRIKAELFEEAAPIDSEARREAEIIRQVREADVDERRSVTAQSSPALLPTVPGLEGPLEEVPEEESESNMSVDSSSTKGLFGAFNLGPARNGNGRNYSNLDNPAQTPPPQFPPAGSSAVSDDINMDSPSVSSTSTSLPSLTATARPDFSLPTGWVSRSSTPQPLAPPSAADGLKKSNKRRRDDDLDGNSLKRRAVSPGVSVHNSPVLSQSPAQRDTSLWGAATKLSREHAALFGGGERPNNGAAPSTAPSVGPKRIGLQGMTDTSDGLMKMSIE
ncbi:uncharacterized protein EI97DRAFT_450946 [Westerdykella ornata]|uniref:Uncharacterized protein n=1 Tax=Westerdykella ornata TaxID=318751 RepID=A0A6A6JHB0_WESOR|nr:uncharacterized protein EI97DRAFT_450946 [Westerdykella ornata]KAF2275348.1 hypothetical protein EI97DRAFT_450946 [Westerdykella ornata]